MKTGITFMMALLMSVFLIVLASCGGSTTTIMEEDEITTTVETTGPVNNPVHDDLNNPINVPVLLPMARTGEDGNLNADTVLQIDGITKLDGDTIVLDRNSLTIHLVMDIVADMVSTPGPGQSVIDGEVDGKALCSGYIIVDDEDPADLDHQLDLLGGEVVRAINFADYQLDYDWTDIRVTGSGQVDPSLSIAGTANQVQLVTTTTTTTERHYREEVIQEDGIDGSWGLIGLLGLALDSHPLGTAVRLTCGDPVDADTLKFRVPPRYDEVVEPDPDPTPYLEISAPASSRAGKDINFFFTTNCPGWKAWVDGEVVYEGTRDTQLVLVMPEKDLVLTAVGCGLTKIHTVRLVSTVENISPVAVASATPTSGVAPLTVNFDGSASYDTDGTIDFYLWSYDDGGGANGINPSHTFTSSGVYDVTLKVTDDDGAFDTTATGTITITVTEPGGGTNYELFIAGTTGPLLNGATWSLDETASLVFNIIEWRGDDGSNVTLSPSQIVFDSSELPSWTWDGNTGELMTVLYAEPLDPDLDDPGNMFINPGSYAVQFSATHQNGDTDVIDFTLDVIDRADWPPV